MSKPLTRLLPLLLLCVAAAGCGGTAPAGDAAETAAPDSDRGSARVAPEFTLPRIGGGEVSLADSAGSVRLVDFWATWCAPCREEIPMLNELQQTYGERGFEILAISDEGADVIEEFMKEHSVEYTNLVGPNELFQEYGALGMPTGFLVDGEGYIAEVYFGAKPRKALIQRIEELLAAS